jgi:hypothetical protein
MPIYDEQVVGCTQLLAGVDASALAAQPFAEEQLRPGEVETELRRRNRSIASRYRSSAAALSLSRARELASTPSAQSVPQGRVVSGSRQRAGRSLWGQP